MHKKLIVPAGLAAICLCAAPVPATSVDTFPPAIDLSDPPFSLATSGCGTVVDAPPDGKCTGQFFQFDDGGLVVFAGLQDFASGDRLYVQGNTCLLCLLVNCGVPYAALLEVELAGCDAGQPPFTQAIAECVTVVQTGGCGVLLQADGGALYFSGNLVGEDEVGRRFFATGDVLANADSFCLDDPDVHPAPIVGIELSGCSPDLNGDGGVDAADLASLLGNWGPCLGNACNADLNHDGVVNASDLAHLLGQWR